MLVTHLSPRALVKEMLQSSSLYSIAMIGQRLSSLIMVPILTRHLTPADYGALDLLEQIGVVTGVLLGANFSESLGYFYYHKDNQENHAGPGRTVTTTLIGSLMIGCAAAAAASLLAPLLGRIVFRSDAFVPYIRLVALGLGLSFVLEAGLGWLRIENRARTFVLAALGRTALSVVAVLVLVAGLHWRIGGVLGGNLIAGAFVTIPLTVYCLRIYGLAFDRALFLRMVRYAVPIALSASALFVIHFGDRFILPHYRSFQELGLYAIAYKLGMLISFVHGSFHTYWSAQVFRLVQRDDAHSVVPRIFTYMCIVLSFCALAFTVGASPALRIFATPAYYGAVVLVPVIVSAYLMRAIGDYFRSFFYTEGCPGNDSIVQWIAAVFCLGAYFLLIPHYGAMGAAIATLLTFLAVAIISMVWVYRIRPYRLEGTRLIKIAAITAALGLLHFLLPVSSLVVEIGLDVLLLAAYWLLLILARVPLDNEWHAVLSVFRRLTGRLARMPADL